MALFLLKTLTCDAKNSDLRVFRGCYILLCWDLLRKERDKCKVSLMNRSSLILPRIQHKVVLLVVLTVFSVSFWLFLRFLYRSAFRFMLDLRNRATCWTVKCASFWPDQKMVKFFYRYTLRRLVTCHIWIGQVSFAQFARWKPGPGCSKAR